MKKIFLLLFFFYLLTSWGCTTAVISGKYTRDGRPMLWKNRDTRAINNALRYFDDGKYAYVGLVNSKDTEGKSIWIGLNSEGFAIMNSASYNLNLDNDDERNGWEGRIMKKALATCKTLADFEALLDQLPRPTGLEANFGVIDASGGAAYYEVNNYKYVKFDANDPAIAPFGYIIRTNYSHSGPFGLESSGYIRYNAANELFYNAVSTYEGITAQYIQKHVAKNLYHYLTKDKPMITYYHLPPETPKYIHFRDYIARPITASSVVVEGVKKGENPSLATLWANVGFPLASVIVPVWVTKIDLPKIVRYDNVLQDSPISYAATWLKKYKIMNIRWGKVDHQYININALVNVKETGIDQIIKKHEKIIYAKTYDLLEKWHAKGKPVKKDIKEMYDWLDGYISDMYHREFRIDLFENTHQNHLK